MLDLGANRGQFALELHQRFGCRVHAVEPAPELVAELRGPDWLTLTEAAVCWRSGSAKLMISGNAEASCLEETAGAIEVRAITLEQLLGSIDGPIDLVKMDIEGAELDVLDFAPEQTLQRIRQLTVEFHQFLHPALHGRIEAVKRRLYRLGFWSLDFSRCNYDVLFARYELGVGRLGRLHLKAQKYRAGMTRLLGSGQLLGSSERAHSWPGAGSTAQ